VRFWAIVLAVLAVLAVGIAAAVTHRAMTNIGSELAVAGVYLEESGVPMPVPSEVSVGYLGQRLGAHPWALAGAWVGLTALVVLGATNLFAISRRWGPHLVTGWIGTVLHLTPDRLARAQRWFRRWGPLAIVVSRYVPGLRWAMAMACGALGVEYRIFWISTAISASIWVGGLLMLGVSVGDTVAGVVAAHPWMAFLLPAPAASVVGSQLIRIAVIGRRVARA
jgi:membrane protein DedA with SNARE-associated domain